VENQAENKLDVQIENQVEEEKVETSEQKDKETFWDKIKNVQEMIKPSVFIIMLLSGLFATALVLYFIIFVSKGYYHADCTDTILWAEAVLDGGALMNEDFYYACLLPFGGHLLMVPFVAMFGVSMKAQIIGMSIFAVLFAVWTFTGKWPWLYQPYNSYILQAQSWLNGRLDLGQNYSHLEIAVFNGKYYISFPPFPSFVMLPFVAMGFDTSDGLIALVSALLGGVYAFRILRRCGFEKNTSVFFSLFLTVASNWLFTAQTAWVWFIAQNMAFTLSLMAIYYALKGRAALSLAFWAC
jgi:hypothetical protein